MGVAAFKEKMTAEYQQHEKSLLADFNAHVATVDAGNPAHRAAREEASKARQEAESRASTDADLARGVQRELVAAQDKFKGRQRPDQGRSRPEPPVRGSTVCFPSYLPRVA